MRYLAGTGIWVRGADLEHPEFREPAADEFVLADLRDPRACAAVMDGIDEVYALAADMGGMGSSCVSSTTPDSVLAPPGAGPTMRIAVLGCGRIGSLHAETLHADGHHVVLFDTRPGRAAHLAARLPGATSARFTPRVRAALDAAVVATPSQTHAPLVTRLLEAGTPVFCEKPLATSLRATERLGALAERTGTPLQVGFQRRFDAGFAAAREAVRSGRTGRLYAVRVATHDPAPPPPEYLALSGGIFRDLHIHDFDAVRYVTGAEIEHVTARGATLTGLDAPDDFDTTAVILGLSNGALALLSGLRHDPLGYDVRMEVYGAADTVVTGLGARTPLRVLDDDAPREQPPYTSFLDRFASAYAAELRTFVDVARGARPNPCTWVDAARALAAADAAARSARTGRSVRLA